MEARAEVTQLMMVHKNIISPKSNGPVMGIVQDTLLGSQKLTQRDTFISKDMTMNMLMWIDHFDGMIPVPAVMVRDERGVARAVRREGRDERGKVTPLWTGKQLYSMLLPVGVVSQNEA